MFHFSATRSSVLCQGSSVVSELGPLLTKSMSSRWSTDIIKNTSIHTHIVVIRYDINTRPIDLVTYVWSTLTSAHVPLSLLDVDDLTQPKLPLMPKTGCYPKHLCSHSLCSSTLAATIRACRPFQDIFCKLDIDLKLDDVEIMTSNILNNHQWAANWVKGISR